MGNTENKGKNNTNQTTIESTNTINPKNEKTIRISEDIMKNAKQSCKNTKNNVNESTKLLKER